MSADPDPLRVAITTHGCKVNRVESESIAAELLGRGVSIVDEAEAAVVVLNSCSVTAEADRKARKAVRHALNSDISPIVVVTGCLAAHDPDGVLALSPRVVIEHDKEAVASRVAELLGVGEGVRGPLQPATSVVRSGEAFRTRATVKIQDGCDNFCTYCIIAHLRGEPRSIGLERIETEVATLAAAGTAEVVLTGINIGRYRDPETGARLPQLIKALAAAGARRIRVSSIEPPDVDDELLETLAGTSGVCPHLHIPLQSGSDRILAAMGRHYDAPTYLKTIERARAAVEGLAITTDVIVGFPGETEDDLAQTLAMVERAEFAKLHVFRYSPRLGTPAAGMLGHLDPSVKAERSARMRALGERLVRDNAIRRAGRVATVLIEGVDADGQGEGTTEDYLKVRIPSCGSKRGELVGVRLAMSEDGSLIGVATGERTTASEVRPDARMTL